MAITCKYMSKSGIFLDSAYINISYIAISKQPNQFLATSNINIYATRESCKEGKQPLETMSLQFVVDKEINTIKQSYDELKKEPLFTDVVDC